MSASKYYNSLKEKDVRLENELSEGIENNDLNSIKNGKFQHTFL